MTPSRHGPSCPHCWKRTPLKWDAAETAEQAIDYLTRHRPDVIFMDHLMPGMDGFQGGTGHQEQSQDRHHSHPHVHLAGRRAVCGPGARAGRHGRAAKAGGSRGCQQGCCSSCISSMPLRMWNRKFHWARALSSSTAETQLAPRAGFRAPPTAEVMLRDQIAELRRFMVTSLDQQSERIIEDVRVLLRESAPAPAAPEPPAPAPAPRSSTVPWMLALAAGIAGIGAGHTAVAGQRAARSSAGPVGATAPICGHSCWTVGRDAVNRRTGRHSGSVRCADSLWRGHHWAGHGSRHCAPWCSPLPQQGLKGTVEVRRYAGRYCLAGNGKDGYSLAENATPYVQCDLVADATDPVLGPGSTGIHGICRRTGRNPRQYGQCDSCRRDHRRRGGTEGRAIQTSVATRRGCPPPGEWNAGRGGQQSRRTALAPFDLSQFRPRWPWTNRHLQSIVPSILPRGTDSRARRVAARCQPRTAA